jgi:Flp pilus assembly secretin CpaC
MLALFLAAPAATLAQQSSAGMESAPDNIRITVRIGRLDDGRRVPVKSHQMVVASGTPGSQLLSGQRVPIPTGGKDSAISYQNIGFASNVTAWIVKDGRIRVMAEIEDSRLVEGQDGAPPTVETRQLTVNATLTPGKPLELVRAEGPDDRSGFVEVEAELLE